MISVPNHLLRLNGNKIPVFCISLLLVLQVSCIASRAMPENHPAQSGNIAKKKIETDRYENMAVPKQKGARTSLDSLKKVFPVTIKETYIISLFLPLYLDSVDREQKQKSALTVSRDFYKGFLIAADTLQKCGIRLNIHTFDSEKKWSFAGLLDTLTKNGTDLIIGPIQESHIRWMVDSISKTKKINYVSSLVSNDNCYNKDYYVQSIPTAANEGFSAASMVKDRYKGYKIFVINEKKPKPNSLGQAFASKFTKDSITVFDLNGKGASALPVHITYGDSNLVLIPSNREVFVSAIMSRLRIDSTPMVIIGPLQWQFFKNFEAELWEKMHIHLLSPYFIDYSNPDLNGFISGYRGRYKEEPTVWSYFGFDEMVFYGNMLNQYGKYFQLHMDEVNKPLLHSTYRIRHNKGGCGWQNEYVNILKFENYQLTPLAH